MNKYVGIVFMALCCTLPAIAKEPICVPPNYDVTAEIAAEKKALIEQHEKDRINAKYTACVNRTVKPLEAQIESANAKIALLGKAYGAAATSSKVLASKVAVSKKALQAAQEKLASLERQKMASQAKCEAIKEADIQLPKDNYVPKSEKLTMLNEHLFFRKKALELWEAGDIEALELMASQAIFDNSPMSRSVAFALSVAYSRLTNPKGGSFCRIDKKAIKQLVHQVKGKKSLEKILYDELISYRYPIYLYAPFFNGFGDPREHYRLASTNYALIAARWVTVARLQQMLIDEGLPLPPFLQFVYQPWQEQLKILRGGKHGWYDPLPKSDALERMMTVFAKRLIEATSK